MPNQLNVTITANAGPGKTSTNVTYGSIRKLEIDLDHQLISIYPSDRNPGPIIYEFNAATSFSGVIANNNMTLTISD